MMIVTIILTGIIAILSLVIIGIYFVVYNNEKKQKLFLTKIVKGDSCRIVTPRFIELECKVTNVGEKHITVKTVVDKRWIYPLENK